MVNRNHPIEACDLYGTYTSLNSPEELGIDIRNYRRNGKAGAK